MNCHQKPQVLEATSGLSYRWQIALQSGLQRFPSTRGFYRIGLKLLSVKGLTGISIVHITTDPPTLIGTYRAENPAIIRALRSFVVPENTDKLTVDCSATMEYYDIDLNNRPFLNVILMDEKGKILDKPTGYVLFYLQEL